MSLSIVIVYSTKRQFLGKVFGSPEMHQHCSGTDARWFNNYLEPHVLRMEQNLSKNWLIGTHLEGCQSGVQLGTCFDTIRPDVGTLAGLWDQQASLASIYQCKGSKTNLKTRKSMYCTVQLGSYFQQIWWRREPLGKYFGKDRRCCRRRMTMFSKLQGLVFDLCLCL